MPIPRFFLLSRPAVLVLTLFMLAAAGCDSAEETPTTGTITGAISLPAGAGGDIVNTRVSLFASLDEFEANSPAFTTTTDAQGNFSFENINPNSYFVAAWKDNNNSAVIDGGDFFGVIGTNQVEGFVPTRQQVVAGQNTGFNFTILILPPGFGLSVTGTYNGTSASGDVYSLTLTENAGNVTGSGTILSEGQTFPVTTSGTFNPPTLTLSLAVQNVGNLPFTGTVSDDGSTITGTVTFPNNATDTVTLTLQ